MDNSGKENTNLGRFSGRESRRQFLPKVLFAFGSIWLLVKWKALIVNRPPAALECCFAFSLILFVIVVSVYLFLTTVRRLHDLGLSGWWLFLFVIGDKVMRNVRLPIVMYALGAVGLGLWAYICFWPGDKEANKYGPPVKTLDFSWVKWMAIAFAMVMIAEIAAFEWAKYHPVPEQEPEPACVQVFSSDEMERKVAALTVEGPLADFEAFRNETRGNSLTLTNLTVMSRGDLGGGVTELWCQLDRSEKRSRLFVLVYFHSAQMDGLPRAFAHKDRVTAITGTVVANLDKYLRALKEYKGGLNAYPYCGNAIWMDNPVFDVAFADDAPPTLSDGELTGDRIAQVAGGLGKHARQEKVERMLRPLMGRAIEFTKCRVGDVELEEKYCPHVDIEVLDPETQKLAFVFTVPVRDKKTAEQFKGLAKGVAIGHVRAVPCEKGDYYFCRGCMTRFIWMDIVSFSTGS